MSGLFDSKWIVKKIVLREKQNKGAFINPRWGLHNIYIYIYIRRLPDGVGTSGVYDMFVSWSWPDVQKHVTSWRLPDGVGTSGVITGSATTPHDQLSWGNVGKTCQNMSTCDQLYQNTPKVPLLDSFQTGSGQTGSSQKCRDYPWSTLMGKCGQDVSSHGKSATNCDRTWQSVATCANVKLHIAKCEGLWPFCKHTCLSWPSLEASTNKTVNTKTDTDIDAVTGTNTNTDDDKNTTSNTNISSCRSTNTNTNTSTNINTLYHDSNICMC